MTGTGRCRCPSSAPGQLGAGAAPAGVLQRPLTAHSLQPHPLLDAGPPPAAPRVCSRTGMGRKEEPMWPLSPAPGGRPRKEEGQSWRPPLSARGPSWRERLRSKVPAARDSVTASPAGGSVARGVALGLNGLGGGSVRITAKKDKDQAQVRGDLTGPRRT